MPQRLGKILAEKKRAREAITSATTPDDFFTCFLGRAGEVRESRRRKDQLLFLFLLFLGDFVETQLSPPRTRALCEKGLLERERRRESLGLSVLLLWNHPCWKGERREEATCQTSGREASIFCLVGTR